MGHIRAYRNTPHDTTNEKPLLAALLPPDPALAHARTLAMGKAQQKLDPIAVAKLRNTGAQLGSHLGMEPSGWTNW